MNSNKKIVNMNGSAIESNTPQLPELFTDPEVAEYGEVLSTTESGCVFVKKDKTTFMFQPVARIFGKDDEFYYNKVEFR